MQDVLDGLIQCLKIPQKVVSGETFNIGGEASSVSQIADAKIADGQQTLGKEVTKIYEPFQPAEVYTLESSYNRREASQKMGYRRKRNYLNVYLSYLVTRRRHEISR